MPTPPGEVGGGMANSIVGTVILCGLGAAFGVPVGIITNHRRVRRNWLASSARFAADTLNGVPSIVIGIFACRS
jgi:phosphate transport system permease protein